MQFDVFHSLSRTDNVAPKLDDHQVMQQFLGQVQVAEASGFKTVWVAESHFSSEVQKLNPNPVIPNYRGEVGINADSMQLIQFCMARTKTIGFGTAIHNIVGGNGGPIASADRVRSLLFLNSFQPQPRRLDIGFAAGRFPYINAPFGIEPRNAFEQAFWPQVQRFIFLEATEIFLRLSLGETLGSADVSKYHYTPDMFKSPADWERAVLLLGEPSETSILPYQPRWQFAKLKLVPELTPEAAKLAQFVLGSHDPLARDLAAKFTDVDLFNLSFTAPDAIDAAHKDMTDLCGRAGRAWRRSRMPRTVLVFIDSDRKVADRMASQCFDTYIEAMRGTVKLPPKAELMSRALVGDPATIREQLSSANARRFDADDRLMLWFEFNQANHEVICKQMQMFAREVMPHFSAKAAAS